MSRIVYQGHFENGIKHGMGLYFTENEKGCNYRYCRFDNDWLLQGEPEQHSIDSKVLVINKFSKDAFNNVTHNNSSRILSISQFKINAQVVYGWSFWIWAKIVVINTSKTIIIWFYEKIWQEIWMVEAIRLHIKEQIRKYWSD